MRLTDRYEIDGADLSESFIRASGPGGQNVNKVETAVQLRFNLYGVSDLPVPMRARAARLAGKRLTKDGVIIIKAMTHRRRELNREDARARLKTLLLKALIAPKIRIRKKTSLNQKRKRVDAKKKRGLVKQMRKAPGVE
ncbi:MAG: alternative ribosome rescue aminoacyl-tRNA hydrolase ArfB [Parvularculaceae bacterium]